ncbi:MAG: peroxiredoxin [Methyloceanibacter sp.]|uniref:peroxiredoxin n=1 Tax=Methyloceanibacter sp. TaxID=1965321 RepID=UPI003D6C94DD
MTGSPPPAADGAAVHLCTGRALPPVVLPTTDGRDICLATLRGRAVIAVYPWTGRPGRANPPDWDDIPGAHGSTPELEGFRDAATSFTQRRIDLFALSRQTTDYQRELALRLALPFPLLSDAAGHFSAALALPTFTTGGEIYLKRLTLVVADGRIERVIYPVADPAGHASEVLAALA